MDKNFRGRLLPNQPLAPYTSWRVGGPADAVYIPADSDDLALFLKQLPPETPVYWLGLGSNTLIRDGGIEGIVIVTQSSLNKLSESSFSPLTVRAETGVSCGQLARYSARLSLQGIEFMAGIPGTVGGALAMNAGCYGGETWQFVSHVETINRLGEKKIRPATDFEIGYRHVNKANDEWFIAGHFQLTHGDKAASLEKIRQLLEKRNASQPTGLPNCGSVFRNPPENFAARLIEQSGLKGLKKGGAVVSHKHANFIINEGEAKASDIEALVEEIIAIVEDKFSIRLTPEVCIVGKTIEERA
ncbi:MAG TPA: UDP-N-acetylmuramate dehydrogenase [Gammaproteobacteria bacterium]|nr:UDP-N-acetylmuramate dehydrogenase [Gammaproteobacteria bacterium]